MEPITAPAYRLAGQVWKNELTCEEAVEQVVSPANLAQVNTTAINEVDGLARKLAEQDVQQAMVLALLNYTAALHQGNAAVKGKCSNTLGWLYLQQDERERALDYYREALSHLENIPKARPAIARIRLDIGEIDERQGSWDAAHREYQAALASAQELKHHQLESDAHNGLGRVHLALEQTGEALDAFQHALEISRQAHDPRGEETALGNLGLVHRFLGQLEEAALKFRQALTLSREIKHTRATGRHLDNLGNVLLEQGNYDEARQHFQEALEIARQTNDRPGEQQRLGNLGNLYRAWAKRGETPEQRHERLGVALDYQQSALALARERQDRRHQCDHLLNLGNVQSDLQQFEVAQEHFREALRLARKQNILNTQWRVHFALGHLRDEQKRDWLARYHYQKAINIVEQQRQALRIESRTRFWQERSLLYKRMMLCCLRLDDLWAALEHTERARARYLADLLSRRTALADNTPSPIRTVLRGLPDEHAAVVVFSVTEDGTVVFLAMGRPGEEASGSSDPGWRLSPDGCIRAKLIKEFKQHDLEELLIEKDQAGQPSGGYLVEYYAHRHDIDQWKPTLQEVCARLGRTLLMPIHQQLQEFHIKRLILMPNLGLSLLPLHACRLADEDQPYVLDHYEVTYAPSFEVFRHCQITAHEAAAEGASLFAVANPTQDLPWAEFEVEEIARLFSTVRILDGSGPRRATEEAVTSQAPEHSFVHFACHAEFDLRDPGQSALELARPDRLTLDKVFSGLDLPRAQLVVLSACETGLVEPGDLADEYVGLPAGFLQAGAPSVVSSLWAVDDVSTALLMTRFYQFYLKGDAARGLGPMRPAQALCEAQEWLRHELTLEQVTAYISRQEERFRAERKYVFLGQLGKIKRKIMNDNQAHPFADPYYWAAFIVQGAA
jgi:CHAT domain-containing protein